MARRVTFVADCVVRTILGDNGRSPRMITEYRAGWSGLIPDHHYEQALKQGAVRNEDEGQGGTSGEAAKDSGRAKKGHARGS